MVNRSACSRVPSAAGEQQGAQEPLSRETTVPAAITALDASSCSARSPGTRLAGRLRWPGAGAAPGGRRTGSASAACRGWSSPPPRSPSRAAGPRIRGPGGPGSRRTAAPTAGAHDQPDHLADLGRRGSAAGRESRAGRRRCRSAASSRCGRRACRWTPSAAPWSWPSGGQPKRLGDGESIGGSEAGLDLHRDRLVEPVGDGHREPAAVAGQDDPARRRRSWIEPQPRATQPRGADGGQPGRAASRAAK